MGWIKHIKVVVGEWIMSAEVHSHLMDVEAPPCSTWICGTGTQSGHISKGKVCASETSFCAKERPVEPVKRTGTGALSTGQPFPYPSRQVQPPNPRTDGSKAIDPGRRPAGLKAATGFAMAERFGDKFEQDGGRLDILIENAAVAQFKYEPTKDSLQVSNLAAPLVALLLLPVMIRTAREHAMSPRIVVVSSSLYYWLTLEKSLCEDPAMLGSKEYFTPMCPGYCYSELRRNFSGVRAMVDHLMELALAFSAERGSRQLVWAALAYQDHPANYGANTSLRPMSRKWPILCWAPEAPRCRTAFGFVTELLFKSQLNDSPG
ncbi:hypothetical protein FB451DRAFT_1169829 [Mycena latifolia]|nr:hypothetical protein FB451DRAFT_1169829 [Mycena latifolia]